MFSFEPLGDHVVEHIQTILRLVCRWHFTSGDSANVFHGTGDNVNRLGHEIILVAIVPLLLPLVRLDMPR